MPINKKTWLLGYPPYKIARPSAEITLTVNGQNKENGQTFTPPNLLQAATITYTVTATNNGTANLALGNATHDIPGVVSVITPWSSNLLAPGTQATFTFTLDTASAGAKSGWFEFTTNDFTGGEDTYRVNVSYYTISLYSEKLLTIGTKKQQLNMVDVSGTIAQDSTVENNDGTYINISVNNAPSPISGENAPLWNGASSTLNAVSAAFISDFNGSECTVGCWVKMSAAGVWTDSTIRRILRFFVNASNDISIYKTSTNNTIVFEYKAGGVTKSVNHTISTLGWFRVDMTISRSAGASGEMKAYVIGAQVGSTQTNLGTFAGTLLHARYGSTDTPSQIHSGYLSYGTYDTTVLSAANVLNQATV